MTPPERFAGFETCIEQRVVMPGMLTPTSLSCSPLAAMFNLQSTLFNCYIEREASDRESQGYVPRRPSLPTRSRFMSDNPLATLRDLAQADPEKWGPPWQSMSANSTACRRCGSRR